MYEEAVKFPLKSYDTDPSIANERSEIACVRIKTSGTLVQFADALQLKVAKCKTLILRSILNKCSPMVCQSTFRS